MSLILVIVVVLSLIGLIIFGSLSILKGLRDIESSTPLAPRSHTVRPESDLRSGVRTPAKEGESHQQ